MTSEEQLFHGVVDTLGMPAGEPIPVTLSPELIGLLSEQLYRSPSKAIEELIVNGYDAEADESRVRVPEMNQSSDFILVYDDGVGMSYEGLQDLWMVGRRKDRDDEAIMKRKNRKQIGKFGIGKLATYAIANQVTYITKTDKECLAVTIDFRRFESRSDSSPTEVRLPVQKIGAEVLWEQEVFRRAATAVDLTLAELKDGESWTMVLLESLKERAEKLTPARLRRVLRTTLPLKSAFSITLNGEKVVSSKEETDVVVNFTLSEMPLERMRALSKKTGHAWTTTQDGVGMSLFPSGITGRAIVTRESLVGKSSDLMRSEGFFVYVRNRLVNLEDARFGLHELSHQTLNRFRGDIDADDLDDVLNANRESMEESEVYRNAQALLNAVFNEARQQYDDWLRREKDQGRRTREKTKEWVSDRLVEFPVADAMIRYASNPEGAEPDESWMYVEVETDEDPRNIAKELYKDGGGRRPYRYRYDNPGKAHRMVRYQPLQGIFTINQDHELIASYAGEPGAMGLIENVAAAEALLEVYLREAGVSPHVIGEVLERRDQLLRGLAEAHLFALGPLADYIVESADAEIDLEIAVVAGARALGFVSKHIGGNGEPDGLARFDDVPHGVKKITLEAKSGKDPRTEQGIGFSAIELHMQDYEASGCLLVANAYRGGSDDNTARSAREAGVSCWTAQQFADVVRAAEARQITARQIVDVVESRFAPADVSEAVDRLLGEPEWERKGLYGAVVAVLGEMGDVLRDSPRDLSMIAVKVADKPKFAGVRRADVEEAVRDIAGASQGALLVREGGAVILNVDQDELERRVQELTGARGTPRRGGAFGVGG
jgi:hypothetical protein